MHKKILKASGQSRTVDGPEGACNLLVDRVDLFGLGDIAHHGEHVLVILLHLCQNLVGDLKVEQSQFGSRFSQPDGGASSDSTSCSGDDVDTILMRHVWLGCGD